MPAEVTITVKNSEKKLTTNHLIYDSFCASDSDPILKDLVKSTVTQFSDEVESVNIKITLKVE